MKTWIKVLLVALPAAVVGSLFQSNGPIGSMIWPPAAGPSPAPDQLAWLIPIGIVEAVAFGLGAAFLVFGWPYVRRAPGVGKRLAVATYVAIAFGFMNWVPHVAMHTAGGLDFDRLIVTDIVWHIPLIVAAGITATFFVRVLGAGRAAPEVATAPAADPGFVPR